MNTKQIAGKHAYMAKGQSQSACNLDCSITTTANVSLGLFGFQEIYATSLDAFQIVVPLTTLDNENMHTILAPHTMIK